jgi:hypothetical protein
MALFGREPSRPDRRHSTVDGLADPVRHADWTVRLGTEWRLLSGRGTALAVVTNPDRSHSVRSPDGYLLTQTDVAVLDAEDLAAAGATGLRIRDTRSRMIIADCHRTADGIVIRVLPGGPVNQRFIARALAPAVAEALSQSGPWLYRMFGHGQGELRNRDGHLLAADTFTRSVSSGSSDRRGDLTYWTIHVAENPFPTSWLFALLLACEHLRY